MHIGLWHWGGFLLFLVIMLALDLGVFNKKQHEVKVREALITSGIWIALAIVFNIITYPVGVILAIPVACFYNCLFVS